MDRFRRATNALRRRPQAGNPDRHEGVEDETSGQKKKKRGRLPRWLGGSRPGSSRRVETLPHIAEGETELPAEAFVDPAAPTALTLKMETPSTAVLPEQRVQGIVKHPPQTPDDNSGMSSTAPTYPQESIPQTLASPVPTRTEASSVPSQERPETSLTGTHGFTAGVVDLAVTAGNTTRVVERNTILNVHFNPQVFFGGTLAGQGKHGHPSGPRGGVGPYIPLNLPLFAFFFFDTEHSF